MMPVISQRSWIRWCEARGLPVSTAIFAIATCYYGIGLRSRPGTLLVTSTELVHYSYTWTDTFWAIGEPSICVTIELATILELRRLELGLGLKLLQLFPDSAFRITTDDGLDHEFVLQDRGDEFAQSIHAWGIQVGKNQR